MALKRDKADKMIAGVCSGIAKEYDIDVSIVRIGFVLGTLMGFGLPVVVYIVLALILDQE